MRKHSLLVLFFLAVLINACSVDVKINEDTQGVINITTKGDNSNGTVSRNGYLEIDVEGKDADGIKSISIEIPLLNIDFIIDNHSGNESWKINQTFNIVDSVETGVYSVYVILKDRDGNEYSKTITFKIV
ncbi:hypothetical protein [Aureibaculum conchae]|uniref:hypothetical protein n=1 Tax=Aureibaculum sp. 2308TA14-22 TaxID=3108392 RepID=UPI003391268E